MIDSVSISSSALAVTKLAKYKIGAELRSFFAVFGFASSVQGGATGTSLAKYKKKSFAIAVASEAKRFSFASCNNNMSSSV